MGERLAARFRRWLHGLRHLTHRNITGYDANGCVFILACSCERVFWADKQPTAPPREEGKG